MCRHSQRSGNKSGGDTVGQLGLHQGQRGGKPDLHKVPGGSQVLAPGMKAGGYCHLPGGDKGG